MMKSTFSAAISIAIALFASIYTPSAIAADQVVLYSGRSKSLVDPIIQQFQRETGIKVTVKYGNTAQLALTLQEEGGRSPADIFWAQDAGALGAINAKGMFQKLPDSITGNIPAHYMNASKTWIGTSGRARVLAYAPSRVNADALPKSVFDLTDPKWKGRIGWAPTNGSFQAFVTAMYNKHGKEKTKAWLVGMKNNGAKAYPKNTPIIQALAAGEIDLGLPNHYYPLKFKASDGNYPVEQTFFEAGDIGNLVFVSGVGVLNTSKNRVPAMELVQYLLGPKAQQYFTSQIFEYPVSDEVIANNQLVAVEELSKLVPDVNLEDLQDLQKTLALLTEVGLI
jgi:iron(III) transport system substrate-binding protein